MTEVEYSKFFAKLDASTHYPEYLIKVCEAVKADNTEDKATQQKLESKISSADEAIEIMIDLIEGYKGLPTSQNGKMQKWCEVLVVSMYLYYIFYDKAHPFTSVHVPREFTQKIANECKIPTNEQEFLFEGVESANGFYGPQKLRCQCDTPSEMLTLAIWINNNLNKWC